MKKYISIISVLIAILMVMSGCQDMDLLPKENLSDRSSLHLVYRAQEKEAQAFMYGEVAPTRI